MEIEKDKEYHKREFIQIIAERAGFTKEDTLILIDTFIDVVREIICNNGSLVLPAFFKVRLKRTKAKKVPNGLMKGEYPEGYAICFKPSRQFHYRMLSAFGIHNKYNGKYFDKENIDEDEDDF